MRVFGMSLAVLVLAASSVVADVGDQWILGIHHIDNLASFTKYTDAGYSGEKSSGATEFVGHAYGRGGTDGIARVYWELSGNSIDTGRPVPTTPELYSIEYFGTTAPGNAWQPVESQIKGGAGGDTFPIEPLIPWDGQFGTNHQYIASEKIADGDWHPIDNGGDGGPQGPESAEPDAGGVGTYMWLKSGSWVYAKWDFDFDINRSWSAIRLTQVTEPEPLFGDYNENDVVDAADYVRWRKQFDTEDELPNDDIGGIIGFDQYDQWVQNFGDRRGDPAAAAGALVPEPTSCLLICSAGAIGFAVRRRRV